MYIYWEVFIYMYIYWEIGVGQGENIYTKTKIGHISLHKFHVTYHQRLKKWSKAHHFM